jgi:hypothetical protein
MKSNTDNVDPILETPHNDKLEPKRENDRSEQQDPKMT